MIRFHGVFAPNAQLRSEVVPQKEARKLADVSAAKLAQAEQVDLLDDAPTNQSVTLGPEKRLLRRVATALKMEVNLAGFFDQLHEFQAPAAGASEGVDVLNPLEQGRPIERC
jgi:hypothetical protein